MRKVCFVISPIGAKDSTERKAANDLFDLIIEPALEKYDFEIIRADKIQTVASITSEIIQLVQNADLCIVDITGHNPNVMYECGRRHETGKAYVMVAQEGEKLPFDVNTIRTVFYNTKDGREMRSTVKTIQSMVEKMLADGMEPASSGESLSTISDSLKRLERKLDGLGRGGVSPAGQPLQTENIRDVLKSLSPIEAFNLALTQQDVSLAEGLLPILQGQIDKPRFISHVVCQAVALGSNVALQILEQEIEIFDEIDDDELKQNIIAAYVVGLAGHKREKEALEKLQEFLDTIATTPAPSPTLTTESKAFYLNQYQKLLYGMEEYERAAEIGEQVIALCPTDGTYYYNYSMALEKLGRKEDTLACVDKYMALMDAGHEVDGDYLERAVMLYCRARRVDDAEQAYALLKTENPYKALLTIEDEDVAKVLGG